MDININRLTEIEIYTLNPLTGEPDDEHAIWVDDESEVRIEAGSLHLTNAIADTDLKFGQLIAGEFEVTLFNLETDVAGRYIKVWVTENNVRSELFTGKIDSAEHDNVNKHRKITAYDWAYYNRDLNVADFWNTFWETNKNATTVRLDWFRSQLLDYLGIMGGAGSLYNDSLNIAGQYDKVTVLTFESLLIMICELQCALPYINAGGALDFVTLSNDNTVDLRTNKLETDSSRWEDFTVQPIDTVAVWIDSNELYFTKPDPAGDNPYNISGNLLLAGRPKSWQEAVITNLRLQMTGFSYVPCSLNMIVSDLSLQLGQRVRTDKGYSYIMSNEIFGSMWVEQTIECRATSGTRPLMGETYNDNMVNGLKTATITKNIDELNIKYTDVKNEADQLSTDLSIMAGKVVLQVDGTGGVAAMRLDSTGSASQFALTANQINLDGYNIVLNGTQGITITSPNFSVTKQGVVTMTGANVSGDITANSLTLGSGASVPAGKVNGLATVATSGSYNDLSNKPTIPSTDIFVAKDGTIGTLPPDGSTSGDGYQGFKVASDGLMQAANAIIYGTIYASAGLIGGVTIGDNSIYSGIDADFNPYDTYNGYQRYRSGAQSYHINSGISRSRIYLKGYTKFVVIIRSEAEARYDYVIAGLLDKEAVRNTGTLYSQGNTQEYNNQDVTVTYNITDSSSEHYIEIIYTKDGSRHTEPDRGYFYVDDSQCEGVTGREYTVCQGNFKLASNGTLYAKNAQISGTISASNIVGSTISGNEIIGGSINIGNGTFVVDSNGNLTATSATIKGAIEADQVISMKTNASTSFASQTFNVLDTTIDNIQPGLQFNGPAYSSETDSGKIFVYLPRTYGNTLNFYKHIFLTGNYAFGSAKLMTGADITAISYGLLFASQSGYIGRSNFTASDIKDLIDSKVTANPSGTASTALTKLTVGSTIYSVGGTNVVANPSGSASTELAKLTVGSTTYSVSRVSANPPLAGSTTLQRIQIDGTTYEMPSGGGGVGNRVDDSWNGGIVSIPKDSYRNVKQIWLSAGTYLVQATIKFRNIGDIQVGIGTNGNERDLQERVYNGDKISVSRIIESTGFYIKIGVYCKGAANDILTGYNYGSDVDTSDVSIIEHIKLK